MRRAPLIQRYRSATWKTWLGAALVVWLLLGESFALLVRTKPVQFQVDVPDHLPPVRGEAAKLRVVIQNLLSNAEKFTSEGHIQLAAAVDPSGRIAIRVSDTGPGIAPEHHEKIFDIFHQLARTTARPRGSVSGSPSRDASPA